MTHPPVTVSVITISYQDVAGLKKTVDSVRRQIGDVKIEHIVIDGGSSPETVDYLRSLDPPPEYWHSRPDSGRYHAMNLGLAQATGDVVWLMHSGDCFADPEAVSATVLQIPDIRNHWGYAKVSRVNSAGEGLGSWGFIPFDMNKFASGLNTIPHQGAFFGSNTLAKIGPYDENFGLAADQLYMFRAALIQPPVTVNRLVCDFDVTGAGTTRPIRDNFSDLRRAWDLLNYYPHDNRFLARIQSRIREYALRGLFSLHALKSRTFGSDR